MPVRSIDRYHGKHLFIGQALWRKYIKETGDQISYRDFVNIVDTSIEEVKKWVLREPIGFQLHPHLGNIAVNKFMPAPDYKTYINTALGPIVNYNLHTGGYIFKLQWFHARTTHASKQPYWFFDACRSFKRALAVVLKSGKAPSFNSYMQNHFVRKLK